MPAFESESKYPATTSYIYAECSSRLKQRKLSLNLTDGEIAGESYDRKVVNRILNSTRTRNNPYLIPPAYIKPFVEKLKLQGDYELFWGESNNEESVEVMFCNLISDILNEWRWSEGVYWGKPYGRDNTKADIIETVLIDDVSYAKCCPCLDSCFEMLTPEGYLEPVSPFAEVNNYKHISDEERKQCRQNAIRRLFKNTRPIEMFRSFFKETNSHGENRGFSKLEKRLDIFVDKSLMPFMKENIPNERSLGVRVYSIVEVDFGNYVLAETINAQITAEGYDRTTSPEHDEIMLLLTEAGRDYISRLEGLQGRLDELRRKEMFG